MTLRRMSAAPYPFEREADLRFDRIRFAEYLPSHQPGNLNTVEAYELFRKSVRHGRKRYFSIVEVGAVGYLVFTRMFSAQALV